MVVLDVTQQKKLTLLVNTSVKIALGRETEEAESLPENTTQKQTTELAVIANSLSMRFSTCICKQF